MKYLFTLLSFCICSSLAISQVQLDLLKNDPLLMEKMEISSNLNPKMKELLQDPTQMDFLDFPFYTTSKSEASKTTKRTVLTMDSTTVDFYDEEGETLKDPYRFLTFKYDDHGNIIYRTINGSEAFEHHYDENNNMIKLDSYDWDDSLNEYIFTNYYEYIYASERIIQYRITYIDLETNEHATIATSDYDYNDEGQLKTISHKALDDSSNILQLYLKQFFEYDDIGRAKQKTFKNIDRFNNILPRETRINITYTNDMENTLDSVKTFFNQNLRRYKTYKFDEKDRMIELNFFEVEPSGPNLDVSYKYKYDEKDQKIETVSTRDSATDSYEKSVYTYDNSNRESEVYTYNIPHLVFASLIWDYTSDNFTNGNAQQPKLDKVDHYTKKELTEDWQLAYTNYYNYSEREIITIEPDVNPEFSIFPNPASNFIIVNYGVCEWQGEAEIFNLKGHLQKSTSISSDNNFVSLKELSIGTYVLKVRSSDGKVLTTKIVKN